MGSMDSTERELTVDGAVFRIRTSDAGTHYDWISGPNEEYGFATSAGPTTIAEDEEAIRHFLSMVDPATGFLDAMPNFDEEVEFRALLAGAPLAGAVALTDERPWVAVGFDRVGDVAVTQFLHRAHDGAHLRETTWVRGSTGWRSKGGGGSGAYPDDLLREPWREKDPLWSWEGCGGLEHRGTDWTYHCFRISDQVAQVVVPGRIIARSSHGRHLVLVAGTVTAELRSARDELLRSVILEPPRMR